MKSLNEAYIDSLSFKKDQLSLLKAIGNYQGKQALFYEQHPEALKSLIKAAVVESTESSNRIEGITAHHKRIRDIVLKSSMPTNRSEQEIAGYRDALNLLHSSAKDMPVSLNVILQLHGCLYKYLPNEGGKWKNVNNSITEIQEDGSRHVRFEPVSAFETAQYMEKLIEEYLHCATVKQIEPLIIIPAFIFDFLCIHPFLDGNGRTARLLTLLLLYRFGFQVGRFISLERIFEESKETYYEVLQSSSNNWHQGTHNIMPWLNYFWGSLLCAYKEFEARVGTISTKKGGKSERTRDIILTMEIPFSISDIEKACPTISRDTIRNVLRSLRDEGLIKSTGKGRNAKWIKVR